MMTGMNIHFDIADEHSRKRAETLKSLSLKTAPNDSQPPEPRRQHHILSACLSAAFLVGAAGIFYWHDVADVMRAPEHVASVPITDTAAQRNDVSQRTDLSTIPAAREIAGSGFVLAPHMTTVFAKYEGVITHVSVALGDSVRKDQILAQLEDAGTRFALDQAKAAHAQAELVLSARKIDVTQARTLLDRTEALFIGNATSRQALDDARSAMERASNAEAQARQAIDGTAIVIRIAQERVAALTIRAPFSGTVTQLNARVGDTVLARIDSVRENQSLFTIADTENLVIDADIAETSLAEVRQGFSGEAVLDGFPDRPFPIAIQRLAPVASAEKGTVTLRLSLVGPPEGIRPNMAARIRITLENRGDFRQ